MSAPARHPRLGALLVLVGAGLALMIHLHPENLRAPAWVAYAAAGAFGCAGLTLLAQAFGSPRLHATLVAIVIACLLAPALWIVVANPDPDACRVHVLGYVLPASDTLCRAGFAIGAAVGALILALAVRHALRSWRRRDS